MKYYNAEIHDAVSKGKPFIKAYTEYDFIKMNPVNLAIAIAASLLVAGFYEELVFRGFIQNTIRSWFRKGASCFWLSGLFTSILFGLYHLQNDVLQLSPQ